MAAGLEPARPACLKCHKLNIHPGNCSLASVVQNVVRWFHSVDPLPTEVSGGGGGMPSHSTQPHLRTHASLLTVRIQKVLSQSQPVRLGFLFLARSRMQSSPTCHLRRWLRVSIWMWWWWWASTWKLCDAALLNLEPIINSLLIWFTLTWLLRYLVKVGHWHSTFIWSSASFPSSRSCLFCISERLFCSYYRIEIPILRVKHDSCLKAGNLNSFLRLMYFYLFRSNIKSNHSL